MKKWNKLLAVCATVTLLSACGGGGSAADPADQFVGNWQQKCYSWTSDTGATVYSKGTVRLDKATATSLTAKIEEAADYADPGCTQVVETGPWTSLATVNLGNEAVFLGINSRQMTWTRHSNNEVLPGYIGVAGSQLYIRTYTPGTTPTTWGRAYPADKF